MRIQVSGQRIDIGEALRTHVTEGIEELAAKYAGRPTEATVVFSRDRHLMCCEITVHLSTGLTAQASGEDPEIYAAFEAAREKMAKQLRRHKRRLKDHHAGRQEPVDAIPATQTVLAPLSDETEEAEGSEEDGTAWAEGPAIIAETATTVPSLSVGEAVMQMELRHASVLVFRNEARGAINVVYRRDDGTIGWIDPQEAAPGAAARAASGG
jgi:ribosomal subunit interface protein